MNPEILKHLQILGNLSSNDAEVAASRHALFKLNNSNIDLNDMSFRSFRDLLKGEYVGDGDFVENEGESYMLNDGSLVTVVDKVEPEYEDNSLIIKHAERLFRIGFMNSSYDGYYIFEWDSFQEVDKVPVTTYEYKVKE